MDSDLRIGVVTSPHGVRGEVKVYPTTDEMDRFKQVKTVMVRNRSGETLMDIQGVKYFKNMAILKLSGIPDRNQAELYRNSELWIRREQSSPCKENQHFLADLLDMQVVLEDGTPYGILTDILMTAANNVYEITKEDGKKVLIPAIPDCILDVNEEERRMTVFVLPGLED